MLRLQAGADLFGGRTKDAMPRLLHALELERKVGDRESEAWTLQHLGWCYYLMGDVDLQLAGESQTGLDLIRSAAQAPNAPMFVIATAFHQHSLEAFELGVVDYLLKPFSEERVTQCLRRLCDEAVPSEDAVLLNRFVAANDRDAKGSLHRCTDCTHPRWHALFSAPLLLIGAGGSNLPGSAAWVGR